MANPFLIPGLDDDLNIGTLFCIGRNYADHAKEMNSPVPPKPMVFIKPRSTVVYSGSSIKLPSQSSDVHYETEIVIAIGKSAKNVSVGEAPGVIAGYGIGIDVTARDIQAQAKKKGHPWSVAKGFDTFAPLGNFVKPEEITDPANTEFTLHINGELRQHGSTSDMIFDVATLISYLSGIFTLNPGDLIFTGTPEGVGPLSAGDKLVAEISGGSCKIEVGVTN